MKIETKDDQIIVKHITIQLPSKLMKVNNFIYALEIEDMKLS